MIAKTPTPPYYAVIFTNLRTEVDNGYGEMAEQMEKLALEQEGCLGVEYARDGLGITVSYWRDLESIRKWKEHEAHKLAQEKGMKEWYSAYKTRIAFVERDYDMPK